MPVLSEDAATRPSELTRNTVTSERIVAGGGKQYLHVRRRVRADVSSYKIQKDAQLDRSRKL